MLSKNYQKLFDFLSRLTQVDEENLVKIPCYVYAPLFVGAENKSKLLAEVHLNYDSFYIGISGRHFGDCKANFDSFLKTCERLDLEYIDTFSGSLNSQNIVEKQELIIDSLNYLADLRPVFAQIKDGEKLKAACLHYLGDKAQLQAHKQEAEAKHEVEIVVRREYQKRSIRYTADIVRYEGSYTIYWMSEYDKWESEDYTEYARQTVKMYTESYWFESEEKAVYAAISALNTGLFN